MVASHGNRCIRRKVELELLDLGDLNERVAANNWLGRLLRLGSRIDSMHATGATEFNGSMCWQVDYVEAAMNPWPPSSTRTANCSRFPPRHPPPVASDDVQTTPDLDITFSQWRPVGELTSSIRYNLIRPERQCRSSTTLRLNEASPTPSPCRPRSRPSADHSAAPEGGVERWMT